MDVGDITQMLDAARAGDDEANEALFASVYPRLRQIARQRRRGWRGDDTMDTTALVHEAYLKISARPEAEYESRGHFFAVAATAMRQILINYAEKKSAQKRGGGAVPVTLRDSDIVADDAVDDILALNAALEKLQELSERQAGVVECLFFAGYGVAETAEALDVSPATVKRDWAAARAWLYREMHAGEGDGDAYDS
ncbi:MAG: ECF-type sigma factor [Gemmatimonadota bacterium]|nr:ECF-type sigma factor [Gemmatimonadota bacterium]